MIGSATYAITSMLLGILVMRLLGADAGGIFLFAFSTVGQHIFIVSYFGMRPVQITDTRRDFSFGDFLGFRFLTCAAALGIAIAFSLLYAGLSTKATVIIIVAVYKVLDGLADCYESEYQRDGRLDLTGISLTFRTLFVILCFAAAMLITKDLVTSCIVMTMALAAALLVLCILPMRRMANCDYVRNPGSGKALLRVSIWLFVSAFLDLYVFFATKYAIDASQTAAVSGYYGILFIPANIINLMANFVIRPTLTRLTTQLEEKKLREFRGTCLRICGLIGGLTALGMLAAFFLGIPVLGLVLGKETAAAMSPYRLSLVLLILGGGFYAVLNLFYYVLVIFRRQRSIFIIYLFGTVVATGLCFPMSYRLGIGGAAISFAVCMLVMMIAFALIAWKYFKQLQTPES